MLRGATWYKLAPGIALEDGDIVTVGPKQQVQLEFAGGIDRRASPARARSW